MRLLLLFLVFVSALAASERVGLVSSSRGQNLLVTSDGIQRVAKIRDVVHLNDTLETGFSGFLSVTFLDGTVVKMGGSSRFNIKDYFYLKDEEGEAFFDFEKGAFQFMVGKISALSPDRFQARAVHATIGIRGSHGDVVIGADGVKIAALQGHTLTVSTSTGAFMILDDPFKAAHIDALGQLSHLPISGSLFQSHGHSKQRRGGVRLLRP